MQKTTIYRKPMEMKRNLILLAALMLIPTFTSAQQWMKLHHKYDGVRWNIPIEVGAQHFDTDNRQTLLQGHFTNKDEVEIMVPYSIQSIDSITFERSLSDEEKGHNHYRCFAMYIDTENQNTVSKDDWTICHISVDGMGEYSNFSGTARIKGRGNSSWLWYDKKPYKFKLDSKSKLLGLSQAKDWNLLANYRDVTDMMNVVAFETARYIGMPNTNHTRFVEVFLNGEYIGLYQLTEKIEVDDNRVNIDREKGVLLTLDQDDGPTLSPNKYNNFFSKVYSLPMAIKYPDEPTAEQIAHAADEFAVLENAIKAHDYKLVDSLLDIPSFIGILQLHEYFYNVEIDAPRSIYLYKDAGGKYVFGPVWDWDAGFDFDWSNMYTGHDFFSNYKELIYGTDPYRASGASYKISMFFRDMFKNKEFVTKYKDTWNSNKDSLYLEPWIKIEKYTSELMKGSYSRDLKKWPVYGKNVSAEIARMSEWLQNRLDYLTTVINNYPEGDNNTGTGKIDIVRTIDKNITCYYDRGYSQWGSIDIDKNTVKSLLGAQSSSQITLLPLNADGTDGTNTAAGTYGAWFGDNGNTVNYNNNSHVFIESNDMWSWSYGCHPSNCRYGHTHTVTMQYRYNKKAVNVVVTFNIE